MGRVSTVPRIHESRPPRQWLEDYLDFRTAGRRTYVMFSGGRDSSALLALATSCARRRGDDDPVPVTLRHPGIVEAEESDWQELVVGHLRLRDHVVIEVQGEQELVGEPAQRAMRRRGVVWPTAMQLREVAYGQLDPGTVVTGEGGDHVLSGQRITPLRNLLADRKVPSRREIRPVLASLEPRATARTRMGLAPWAWLRGDAVDTFVGVTKDLGKEPFSWARATRSKFDSRAQGVFVHNHEEAIREQGHVPLTPFADPGFHAALAAAGKFWGYEGRTHVFRTLFADLLPDAVLSRQTKAAFNGSRWGQLEKEFAHSWDGDSFDPELIDAEVLRSEWLSDRPGPGSDYLIQLAWAASQGVTTPLADEETFP